MQIAYAILYLFINIKERERERQGESELVFLCAFFHNHYIVSNVHINAYVNMHVYKYNDCVLVMP